MKTKEVYPVFIFPKEKGEAHQLVYIPDWDICTEGDGFLDSMEMARDAIGLMWMDLLGEEPAPSSYQEAVEKARNSSYADLDFSIAILTMVDVDVIKYSEELKRKAVKKNCTIPYWLNEKAEAMGVNFSRVLQDALIQLVET